MEQKLAFEYQARYEKLGSLSPNGELWFVLHGYGQLAPYFIKKFQFLADRGHCVIAPEGLNRFYLKGFSGRVGATWMTKEGRLDDIQNYVNYLNEVYRVETEGLDRPVNLLGFSQGTATVSRWVAQSDIHYDRLFIWAGILPEDLHLESAIPRFAGKSIYFAYGNEDIFITKGRLAGHYRTAENLKIQPELLEFNGEHDIHQDTILQIMGYDAR